MLTVPMGRFFSDCLVVSKIITIFAANAISCLQQATAAMRVSTTQAPTATTGRVRSTRATPTTLAASTSSRSTSTRTTTTVTTVNVSGLCAPRIKSRFGEFFRKIPKVGRRTCARFVSFKNREEGTLCAASGQNRHFFEYSFRIVWRFGDN